jgi:RNA recognition motif-containing protein
VAQEKKLYVGNIAYSMDNDSLKEMFSPFGEVTSAQIIMDRDSGRSKGFGFVEFSNTKEAQAAIDKMNGKEFEGRALTVNEARPRVDKPEGRRR